MNESASGSYDSKGPVYKFSSKNVLNRCFAWNEPIIDGVAIGQGIEPETHIGGPCGKWRLEGLQLQYTVPAIV